MVVQKTIKRIKRRASTRVRQTKRQGGYGDASQTWTEYGNISTKNSYVKDNLSLDVITSEESKAFDKEGNIFGWDRKASAMGWTGAVAGLATGITAATSPAWYLRSWAQTPPQAMPSRMAALCGATPFPCFRLSSQRADARL